MPSKQWDTGPVPADGQVHQIVWNNDFGHYISILKAYIWQGFDYDHIGDIHTELLRKSDGTVICVSQWDRYQPPTLPHGIFVDFPEPGLSIDRNDSIIINYFGNPFKGPCSMHVRADIWWKMDNGYF